MRLGRCINWDNHLERRAELEQLGVGARGSEIPRDPAEVARNAWRRYSDTATLLEAIERWKLGQTLQKCVGMFALALWGRDQRHLTLARDRFGEKPIQYEWVDERAGRGTCRGISLPLCLVLS